MLRSSKHVLQCNAFTNLYLWNSFSSKNLASSSNWLKNKTLSKTLYRNLQTRTRLNRKAAYPHPALPLWNKNSLLSLSSTLNLHTGVLKHSREFDESVPSQPRVGRKHITVSDINKLLNDDMESSQDKGDIKSNLSVDDKIDRLKLSEYEKTMTQQYSQKYQSNQRFSNRKLDDEVIEEEFIDEERSKPHHIDRNEREKSRVDADIFGDVTDDYKNRKFQDDDYLEIDAEDEEIMLRRRRYPPIWYANRMKKLVKDGKLKEAIAMLEIRMLKEDRVQPEEYNYNIVIGACGRAGYTKKAFKLFNEMKRRGLSPSEVTYTALFNACAQSPWATTDGLSRLNKLREQIKEKGIQLNHITYRAQVKACAKCGDILSAFNVFDEMIIAGHSPSVDSFNVLLMACIADKHSGFRLAIQVWRQMLSRRIEPEAETFNLLLRAVRDCGIGDVEAANQILLYSKPVKMKKRKKEKVKVVSSRKSKMVRNVEEEDTGKKHSEEEDDLKNNMEMLSLKSVKVIEAISQENHTSTELVKSDIKDTVETKDVALSNKQEGKLTGIRLPFGLPNLLDRFPYIDQVDSLSECRTPETRLALIGGVDGMLARMKEYDVKPNIKTYTLLLESTPMTLKAEKEMLVVMDTAGVSADIEFCNSIIRRRTKRNDLHGAKLMIPELHQRGLHPNLRTYVNLACACFEKEDGLQLLQELKASGLKPNVPLYGALIKSANRRKDYGYLIELLKKMKSDGVKPNEIILEQLERTAAFTTNIAKGYQGSKHSRYIGIQGFRGYYNHWLDDMEVEEEHPWSKYRLNEDQEKTQ
ncbi:pentatricopeptide repeat-containing protein 1, mitochondrial-like [Saccoglossus kowalevskii]